MSSKTIFDFLNTGRIDNIAENNLSFLFDMGKALLGSAKGLSDYSVSMIEPYLIAMTYFQGVEAEKLLKQESDEVYASYMKLLEFNLDLWMRGARGGMDAIARFMEKEIPEAVVSSFNTLFGYAGDDIYAYMRRAAFLIEGVSRAYPKAIEDIGPEFGFHFEKGNYPLLAETDRFSVYRILPLDPKKTVENDKKPILILPPYVLGANILGFLPKDGKSYAHAYADNGFPVYIRVLKDIQTSTALQTMNGEDDCLDTEFFLKKIKELHNKPVTLNGYCQGGFNALMNLLSGKLDGLVDALITCVAPMDGTRSEGLHGFLKGLGERFNNLSYGVKTLSNGNKVADGKLMGFVYKLKSIETESPLPAFFRDLSMFRNAYSGNEELPEEISISKTALALNYWLTNERFDLPLGITNLSFSSYNTPISADGTLPVTLFGNKLNLKRINEKKTPWLICYGENDELVEPTVATAPADYIDVEISPYPKGHVAMATSFSHAKSSMALYKRFGPDDKYRGPLRFHMDLDEALDNAISEKTTGKKSTAVKSLKKTVQPDPQSTAADSPPKVTGEDKMAAKINEPGGDS